jgi:hypothetical protein
MCGVITEFDVTQVDLGTLAEFAGKGYPTAKSLGSSKDGHDIAREE